MTKDKAARKKKAVSTYETPTDEKKAYGQRLREAREVAGMNLTDAAAALGYSQPVQMSYMENGIRMPTLRVIKECAELYGTTTDFLCGLSLDIDRDPASSMQRYLASRVAADVQHLVRSWSGLSVDLVRKVMPTTAEGQRTAALALEVDAAVKSFRALNPKFDNMRGSNTLMSKAELASLAAKAYLEHIERAKRLMHIKSLRDAAVADGGPPVQQLILPHTDPVQPYPAW